LAIEYPKGIGMRGEARAASVVQLDALYRDYSGWLKRFLRFRFRGRQDYDDIVQDTFVRVSRAENVDTRRDPRGYLRCVATNLVRDAARRAAVRAEDPDAQPDAVVDGDQFETVLLKQIILSLPDIYREVFVLSRFAGMSYAEIAKHCGISVKAVEKRMAKALLLCRDGLGIERECRENR
jgi:RNA polymerase sigma factor (sigma-70 family)